MGDIALVFRIAGLGMTTAAAAVLLEQSGRKEFVPVVVTASAVVSLLWVTREAIGLMQQLSMAFRGL